MTTWARANAGVPSFFVVAWVNQNKLLPGRSVKEQFKTSSSIAGATHDLGNPKFNTFAETQGPVSWCPSSSRSLRLLDVAMSAFEWKNDENAVEPLRVPHFLRSPIFRVFFIAGYMFEMNGAGIAIFDRSCVFLNLGLASWDVASLWGTDWADTFLSWVAKTVAQTTRLGAVLEEFSSREFQCLEGLSLQQRCGLRAAIKLRIKLRTVMTNAF